MLRFTCCVLALLSSARAEELSRFVFERAEMGLPFRITLYAPDAPRARVAADAAFARVAELNGVLSDYDSDSEVGRLSRSAGQGRPVSVSRDLWTVLEHGQAMAARSGGAFDPTVGPVVQLWRRARRQSALPAAEPLAEARSRVGYRNVTLERDKRTATLALAGMRLDFGSIGKAYAVDQALATLRTLGYPQALVAGSGDMAAGDAPPGQPGWRIEVEGPPPRAVLLLLRQGIATSGDTYQRAEIDGRRYSHIVDPRTGIGLTGGALVTVTAADCMTANGLSTAVSVLGPVEGLPLVEGTPGAAARVVREGMATTETSRWAR